MANDEKETKETTGYDEIDKEIGLGETLKDRDNKLKYHKNVLFVLFLAVIGLTFFWVSFKGGQKIFIVYKTMVKDSVQENVTQNNKEIPNVAVDPKADGPVKGEVKSGVKESVTVKIVEPASGQIEKVNTPVMEKNIVQPTKIDVSPVAKAERSAAVTEPETPVPDVKPAAIASTVKPATKVLKQVAKEKKAAAPKASGKHKEYKVIVGSFSIKANADSLIGQLKVNNYEPMVVQTKTPKGQLYRVIAGSYSSLSETKAKIGELRELGLQPFYIVE